MLPGGSAAQPDQAMQQHGELTGGPPPRPSASASSLCSLFLLWWSTSALRLPFLQAAAQ